MVHLLWKYLLNDSQGSLQNNFIYIMWKWKSLSRVQLFVTPWTVARQAHGILQERILEWVAIPFSRGSSKLRDWTQVSRRQILYQLSHKGSPRILEWVAYPFSRGSSRPRNQTGVSGIAGRFFTSWATREVWKFPLSSNFHPQVFTSIDLWTL